MEFKILVIGDPHFMVNNLGLMEKYCQEIYDTIEKEKPDLFVNLGDTLHTHERLHIRPVTAASNFMLNVAKKCPAIMIIGNHDRENNSDFQTDIHPFNALKGHPNITVVDHAIWDKELNFIYVPYVPVGRFREALGTAGWTSDGPQPDLGFSHQEFLHTVDGSYISEKGDPWNEKMFQIINGHIHKYQVLPGIICPGTIQHRFGDDPDNAMMLITLTDIQGTGVERKSKKIYRRIPITSIPKKIVLHMEEEDLNNFQDKIPPNSLVKVFLHISDKDTAAIQKDPRYLTLCQLVESVQIKSRNEKISLAASAMEELKIEDKLSVTEVISKMLQDDFDALHIFTSEIL